MTLICVQYLRILLKVFISKNQIFVFWLVQSSAKRFVGSISNNIPTHYEAPSTGSFREEKKHEYMPFRAIIS